MRYFRQIFTNYVGSYSDERGLSAFLNPSDWEEVILIPKPQPKKHKIKLALFRCPSSESLFALNEQIYKEHYVLDNLIQVTDWVEVDFVEKV